MNSQNKVPVAAPHPLTGKTSTFPNDTLFDILIIGSGAGGAPLAWELSKGGAKVALVESGPVVELHEVGYALEHYYLKQGMTLSTKGCFLPVFAGDTVGGTTSINSGTCLKPKKAQLKVWDEKLGTEFANGLLDPFLDVAENQMGVTVPPKSLLNPSSEIFEKGLHALGRNGHYVLPRSAPGCQGSGRCCFICPTSAKKSTDLAFLPEAVERGCKIFANSRAIRIEEDNQGVTLHVNQNRQNFILKGKKLIIAAGAFGTPGLIRSNRLGSHWRAAGNHLRIHPASKAFAYFPDPVHGEVGVPQGSGYRPPELPRIVFEGIFTPKAASGPLIVAAGQRHRWWLDHHENLACFGLMLIDRTEGYVRNFGSWPLIRYRLNKADLQDLVSGLTLLGEIFFAAGAQRLLLPFLGRQNEWSSWKELSQIRADDFSQLDLLASGFHPQGTAALGEVIDLDFKLKGTQSIYVSDASVLPNSPGVNPQVTIMGLSLLLADKLKSA